MEHPSARPQSDTVGVADEVASMPHNKDLDMTGSQLDFGLPTLLRQDQRADGSQTQLDDDDQIEFGKPSLLQEESQTEEDDDQGVVLAPQSMDDAEEVVMDGGKGTTRLWNLPLRYPRTPQQPALSPWRVRMRVS